MNEIFKIFLQNIKVRVDVKEVKKNQSILFIHFLLYYIIIVFLTYIYLNILLAEKRHMNFYGITSKQLSGPQTTISKKGQSNSISIVPSSCGHWTYAWGRTFLLMQCNRKSLIIAT